MSIYTIEFISGLKPAGNNDFPLIQAKHVQIADDGTRLSELFDEDIFPQQKLTFDDASGVYYYTIPEDQDFKLIPGKTYTVVLDDKTYTCQAKYYDETEQLIVLGNASIYRELMSAVSTVSLASVQLDAPYIRLETVNENKLTAPTIYLDTVDDSTPEVPVDPDKPTTENKLTAPTIYLDTVDDSTPEVPDDPDEPTPDDPDEPTPDDPDEPVVESNEPFVVVNSISDDIRTTFFTKDGSEHTAYIYTQGMKMVGSNPPIVEVTPTDTIALAPDKYYVFGEVNSLAVELENIDDGNVHEHSFEFIPTENFTNFIITPAPKWASDPQIVPGKTHQVSIVRGIGVMICA